MKTSSRGFSLAQLLLAFVLVALLLAYYRAVHFVSRDWLRFFGATITPDGNLLAVHSSRGLAFYEVETGRIQRTIREVPWGPIYFSPDGRQAVVKDWYYHCNLSVWDLNAGKETCSFSLDNNSTLQAISFSKGLAASYGANANLEIWSLKDGQRLHSIPGIMGSDMAAAFSPDGETLAVASSVQSQLTLWDTRSGTRFKTMPYDGGNPTLDLTFGPDGQWLLLGEMLSDTTHLWTLWDDDYSQLDASMNVGVAYSPDGTKLAFVDLARRGKRITILDLATRDTRFVGEAEPYHTRPVFVSPRVVLAMSPNRMTAWDVETNQLLWKRDVKPSRVVFIDISFSQDQRKLAIFDGDGAFVDVWDTQDGIKLISITAADLPGNRIPQVTWSLLSAGGIGWFVLWCLSRRGAHQPSDGRRDFGWLLVCFVVAIAVGNGVLLCNYSKLAEARIVCLTIVFGWNGLALLACFVSAIWVRYQRFCFWFALLVLASVLVYDVAWIVVIP